MRRLVILASIAATASLAFVACVSDDNSAPPAAGDDAGSDGAVSPGTDAGNDATTNDAASAGDANDDAPVTPLVCSDAGTGRCLVILAQNQGNPVSALVHGGYLYWLEEGAAGRIQRIPVGGGPIEQLATGQDDAFDMTADDTSLYWAREYQGTVYSAPLTGVPDGGAPTLLAQVDGGAPFSVSVDATRIYWTDPNAGNIYAAPLGGITDGGAPAILASNQPEPWDIANDGTNLYWTNNAVGGSVMALSIPNGGAPFAIAPLVNQPTQLQVTGTSVYFITNSANYLYAAPTSGLTDGGSPSSLVMTGPDSTLDASTVTTTSFVFDGPTIYWTTSGNPGGEVRSAGVAGSGTTLARGLTSPGSLVSDATNIYWTNAAFGAVFEMAK